MGGTMVVICVVDKALTAGQGDVMVTMRGDGNQSHPCWRLLGSIHSWRAAWCNRRLLLNGLASRLVPASQERHTGLDGCRYRPAEGLLDRGWWCDSPPTLISGPVDGPWGWWSVVTGPVPGAALVHAQRHGQDSRMALSAEARHMSSSSHDGVITRASGRWRRRKGCARLRHRRAAYRGSRLWSAQTPRRPGPRSQHHMLQRAPHAIHMAHPPVAPFL